MVINIISAQQENKVYNLDINVKNNYLIIPKAYVNDKVVLLSLLLDTKIDIKTKDK